ncbi:MAM and LDL-receptor class A domain-containing protein 1-like [Drosophila biarmipes]|uniref:MAM and LDL-receptor class A domain-containing protein 1-like n=1 Tax=Drosophila biarmipes TaxID=125945 RepID=UPI0007E7EDE6|nr:MAM and LDL-receptor class A domain-containing protein 1-like [Drosophila biarmipes]
MVIAKGSPAFECKDGYTLLGRKFSSDDCPKGLLRGERSFCAKTGCKDYQSPRNGNLTADGLKAMIECVEGLVLYGNRVSYCNGEHWSTELGKCLKTNDTGNYFCNFEAEDQCGWTAQTAGNSPWKRISVANDFHSNSTGPRSDHSFASDFRGHFMRMETGTGYKYREHFMSPLYPRSLTLGNSLCFQFYVFMFGRNVRSLGVSVKPESLDIDEMHIESVDVETLLDDEVMLKETTKFVRTGDQGAEWLRFSIPIDEMKEDFQVVFTAIETDNEFGDIGIDDVELTKGQCRSQPETSSETTKSTEPLTTSSTKSTFKGSFLKSGANSSNGWGKYTAGLFTSAMLVVLYK